MSKINVIFYSVVILAIVSAGLEVFLIYHIATTGNLDSSKSVIALINGAVTFGALKLILQYWQQNFISTPIFDSEDLRTCFAGRLRIVLPSVSPINPIVPVINRQLISQYLILLESLLKKKLGNFHYELSIFCGKEEPEIVAYYDSSGNLVPRSQAKREENPRYYIESKYEVVELLNAPSSRSIIIDNVKKDEDKYSFTSPTQKKTINSTLLHCVESQWPAVLVLTCDKSSVLGNSKEFEDAFLGVYNAIAADLNLGLVMNAG